jgi:hypothetical protein
VVYLPGKLGKTAEELNINNMELTTDQLFKEEVNGGYSLNVM